MEGKETNLSFWKFLRAFGQDWLTLMSGPLAVPFAIAATFFSGWARSLLLMLAASCIVFASFRVWRNNQREIAKLKIRPYDDTQKELVNGMLAPLGADERDVLRYFLQFGEREQQRIFTDAGINDTEFGPIFTRVANTGLLNREERQKAGRAGLDLFWWVNPQFVEVLKGKLFPRNEKLAQRCFLAR